LFDATLLLHGLLQGAVVMAASFGIFWLGIGDNHGEQIGRSVAFVTLVLGNLGLVLTNRSMTCSAFQALARPDPALVVVMAATLMALTLSVIVPWLQGLFGFAPLSLTHLAEAAGAGLGCIVVNDGIWLIWRYLARGWPHHP
jgi:Ca2+-transporting ATPase